MRPYCEKVIPAQTEKYDMVVYPEIEGKPLCVAILYRNRWMMEIADLAVVYVDRDRGGSYQAYCHAKRKGTRAYDLAEVNL